MVGKRIRDQIDDLDEIRQIEAHVPDDEENNDGEIPQDITEKLDNVALGSKLPPISFDQLEQDMKADPAFNRFRLKFSDFFARFLHTYEGGLPDGKPVNFKATDTVRSRRRMWGSDISCPSD